LNEMSLPESSGMGYAGAEHHRSYGPLIVGAFCPNSSMPPGRRLNVGEAPGVLPS
jgi:hypothetical protein